MGSRVRRENVVQLGKGEFQLLPGDEQVSGEVDRSILCKQLNMSPIDKIGTVSRTLPAVLNLNLCLTFAVSLPFHGNPEASESRMYCMRDATCSPSTGGGSDRIRTALSLCSGSRAVSCAWLTGRPRRTTNGRQESKLQGGYSSIFAIGGLCYVKASVTYLL